MTAHTPGPWTYELHNINGLIATIRKDPENYNIASITGIDAAVTENEANTRLIAAAPELLEACQRLLLVGEGMARFLREQNYGLADAWDIVPFTVARAAIAKAKGKLCPPKGDALHDTE